MASGAARKFAMISIALMVLSCMIVMVNLDSEESDAASYGTASNPRTSVSLTWANVRSNNYTEIYVVTGSSFSITHTSSYECFSLTDSQGNTVYDSAWGLTISSTGNLSGTISGIGSSYVTYNDVSGGIAVDYHVTIYMVQGSAPAGSYTENIYLAGWDSWDYRTYNPSNHTYTPWSSKYYANGVAYVQPNHHLQIRWHSTSLISGIDSYLDRISSSQYGTDLGSSVTVNSDGSYYPAYKRVTVTVYNTNQSQGGTAYVSVVDDYQYGMFAMDFVGPGQSEIIYVPGGATIELEAEEDYPYIFDYWRIRSGSTSSSNPYDYNIGINNNTIVDVYWKATPYTLNLNANGGSVSPTSTNVYYGWNYGNLPTPTRQGYGFEGWYTAATGGTKITSSTPVPYSSTGTLTAYAHWSANTYTVTFNASTNGGYPNSTGTVSYGSTYGTLPTASKAGGYTFAGWYTAATGGTQVTPSTPVPYSSTGTITLYAQFTVQTFTVTISAGTGGYATIYQNNNPSNTATAQAGGTATITVPYDSYVTATAYPNSSSHFVSWTYNGNITVDTNPYSGPAIRTNTTYHANFGAGAEHTVTFDYWTNEGSGVSFPSKTVINGQEYGELPISIKEGMEFTGWFTESTGGTKILPTTTVSLNADQTLYAQFASNELTVTINITGGSATVTDGTQTITVTEETSPMTLSTRESTVTVTAIPGSGYYFNYWNYFWNGDTSAGGYENDNPWELTLMGNVEIFGICSQTVISKPFYAYVNNTNYGTISNGIESSTFIEGIVRVGDVVSISNNVISIGNVIIIASANIGYEFSSWTGVTNGQIVQNSDANISFTANFTPSGGENVWWSNDYANGSVEIVFDFSGLSDSYKHRLIIPLWEYNGAETSLEDDPHGLLQFSRTPYTLVIENGYNTDLKVSVMDGGLTVKGPITLRLGNWQQYALEIDAQTGIITFKGIHNILDRITQPFSFVNYTVTYSAVAADVSDVINGMAIERIYHEDDNGTVHPHFQVSRTLTYLNTYGFVMTDPTINIIEQFPNYNDLRLNFYSFAYYGDDMTVNGHTMQVQNADIILYYIPQGTPIYDPGHTYIVSYYDRNVISEQGEPDAKELRTPLSNIYITWNGIKSENDEDRVCSLTFVDSKLTIDMGNFQPNDLTVSFTGVWYFTTALYEPYTAKETSYEMDWWNLSSLDRNGFILIFDLIIIIGYIVANRIYVPGFMDKCVVIGALVFSFVLLAV